MKEYEQYHSLKIVDEHVPVHHPSHSDYIQIFEMKELCMAENGDGHSSVSGEFSADSGAFEQGLGCMSKQDKEYARGCINN